MLLNCDTGQDSWESLGLYGSQVNQSYRKSTLNILWKDWSQSSNMLATWCKQLTHWKWPWCWERLRAGGEGGDRGWDGWISSTDSVDMSLSKLCEIVTGREAWRATVHGVAKSQAWFSNWTTSLTKEMQHFYSENSKTLMKETEDDWKKWKYIICSWIGRIKSVKMSILHEAIYGFNAIHISIFIEKKS